MILDYTELMDVFVLQQQLITNHQIFDLWLIKDYEDNTYT